MRDGQLWLIAADGGEPRALTKHATPPLEPDLVARRHRGVFHRRRSAVGRRSRAHARARRCGRARRHDPASPAVEDHRRDRRRNAADQAASSSVKSYSIAANGKRMVVQRAPTPADMDAYRGEVWVMDATGENPRVADQQRHRREVARLSPDGTQVLFLADTNERFEPYYPTNLFVVSAAGGAPRARRAGFARARSIRRCGRRTASRSSPTSTWACTAEFFRIDAASRTRASRLTDGTTSSRRAGALVPGAGKIVFQMDEPTRFGEVWTLPMRGRSRGAGARHAPVRHARARRSRSRARKKRSGKAPTARRSKACCSIRPTTVAGQRYPLVVQLHGGPMESDKFGIGAGCDAVLRAGADRQGLLRAAAELSRQRRLRRRRSPATSVDGYFHQMASDVLLGVDALIARGLVDQDRLVLTGWSAGGTLVDKLITMTDRFKVASSGAGISNWISLYGQTDSTVVPPHLVRRHAVAQGRAVRSVLEQLADQGRRRR